MLAQQKLTSIKRIGRHDMMSPSSKSIFMSPASKNILEEQLQELQLLSQQELVQRLNAKKKQVIRKSEQITQNCHRYFMDLTSAIIEVENSIKKNIDAQTLSFLEEIEHKIDIVRQNQHSYNCNSQVYQTLKLLLKNYTQTQEQIPQVKKMIERCYSVSLQGFTETSSQINMNTTDNKIYISGSEFITTNKKIHGNSLEITERQFQLALAKFQQREQKQMLINERLKNKVKSLEEMLSKKGLNIKEFNKSTTAQNERTSQDYWDLQLQRVKAQNTILTQQITLISNKLIQLISQNQSLKGQYKKMLHSNISQISNQNNTIFQAGGLNLQQHSRLQTNNFIPSQTIISNTVRDINIREEEVTSGIFVQSNLFQNSIQNEMLVEYERKSEYLSVELTKRIKELEELRGELDRKDKLLEEANKLSEERAKQLQSVCHELQRLSNHSSTLEHDYQVSSKKRFQLEQRISALKHQLKELKQKQTYSSLQTKLQIQNLQSLLKLKQEDITKLSLEIQNKINIQAQLKYNQLNNKNQQLQKQKNQLKSTIVQNKSQYQGQLARFKEEFKRLQQTITSKDQQMSSLMQQLYQTTKLNQQTQEQNSSTYKEKYQTNKKQLNKLKKQLKDKTKQLQALKLQSDKLNQLAIKIMQINTHFQSITKDLEKLKLNYQAKIKLLEDKLNIVKDKNSIQFNQLIAQSNGQCKKSTLIQTIDKYSQSMTSYAQKTAQLKKLKDELKQLKSNKPTNPKPTKKQPQKDPQLLKKLLQTNQQELTQMQISIRQDRINIQKSILQEKLSILEEEKQLLSITLESKQRHIKTVEDQAQRLRKQVKNNEQCIKKQSNQQQLKTVIKSLQNKVQKLQSELKSTKLQHKKTTEELSVLQTQLKKKKDHISNVKKQLTSNQDQLEQLNSLLKNKTQEIQKLKRQLKDQSTKQTLLTQMKQKVQAYQQLQLANQQLKKQIDKHNSSSKFQINKLTNQIKELKAEKKQQINQKVSSKTHQLHDQLNDLKTKYKKLKTQLERKQTLNQHLKSKSDAQLTEVQTQLQQTLKQLTKKSKECQNYQKKLQTTTSNQRKYKEKCKLLTVVLQKLYTRMLNQKSKPKSKHTSNKENTLLHNTSPISQVINSNLFNSNLFNTTVSPSVNKHKEPSTLETFKQLDINLDDLEKYSEGLEMFGVNTCQLKNMQKELGFDNKNETSTISCLMASPENKNDTIRNNQFVRSGINEWDAKLNQKDQNNNRMNAYGDVKEKVNKLSECLNGKEEIDVAQVLYFFDQIIEESQ